MGKRLTQDQKNGREARKLMDRAGKATRVLLTGKTRRKKSKLEKIIDVFTK